MKDLAMHIMDIADNSLRAGAKEVLVKLRFDEAGFYLTIRDDGCGMDKEMVERVWDPFVTTRHTRKAGLGLSLLKRNALQTGGRCVVNSEPGQGTSVEAYFCVDHIDCIPTGEMGSTLALLITGNPQVNFVVEVQNGDRAFCLSTEELKKILEGLPLSHPKVSALVRQVLVDKLSELNLK